MKYEEAILLGQWAGKENNIKKARKIKNSFDNMVAKSTKGKLRYGSIDWNEIEKNVLTNLFNEGYKNIHNSNHKSVLFKNEDKTKLRKILED